jgi:hypothetical protein
MTGARPTLYQRTQRSYTNMDISAPSLRALVATDAGVRTFYRAQRRRQLDLMAGLGGAPRAAHGRLDDAILLFTLERVCDALADGELRELGLSARAARALLEQLVLRHITGARASHRP